MIKSFFNLGTKILASNLGTLPEPYKITFSITYNCNSRCKTCGIWKKQSKNELSTREIEKIFQEINPPWVNLTGGEPFLRKDLYEITNIISKNNTFLLNLTTNGLLPKKVLKDVKKILTLKIPKFIVVVSLDGPPKVHDNIRGIPGNWDKAIGLYRELRKISKKSPRFETYLGYTASSHNIGQFFKTFNSVKNRIPDFELSDLHLNFYHESDIYFDNKTKKDQNRKFLTDLKKTISKFKSNKISLNPISIIEFKYLDLVDKYLKTRKSPLPCRALQSSCYIDPHGNVYPCAFMNTNLGNLRDLNYNLKKIWNSPKAQKARKLIKQNKCPGCWTPCEAYQTILGNIFNKNPL